MPSRLLDKFLERANKVRGDLPELTEKTFSELLRNRHTEQFERWLPVFKKLARCKPAQRPQCLNTVGLLHPPWFDW